MKVYVAGASAERVERAKPVIAALRAAGIQITHDWTDDPGFTAEKYTHSMAHKSALDDMRGVCDAHVLLLLMPQKPTAGAWVELGIALGKDIPIMLAGLSTQACIFGTLTNWKMLSDEAAVAALISLHHSCPAEVA